MNIQQVLIFAIAIIIALWLGAKWLQHRGKSGREAAKYMQHIIIVVALLVAVGYTLWSKPRPMMLWEERPKAAIIELKNEELVLTEEQMKSLEKVAGSIKVSRIGTVKSFPDATWHLYEVNEDGEKTLLWATHAERGIRGKTLFKGDFKPLLQCVEGLIDE